MNIDTFKSQCDCPNCNQVEADLVETENGEHVLAITVGDEQLVIEGQHILAVGDVVHQAIAQFSLKIIAASGDENYEVIRKNSFTGPKGEA